MHEMHFICSHMNEICKEYAVICKKYAQKYANT